MTLDPDEQFRHDRSAYERPNLNYRCERAARWGTPCRQGPNYDGTCGGVYECAPAPRGRTYACQRSAALGGPCSEGPGADGICGRSHPPCAPRRSLRAHRGRLSLVAFALAVALIGAFFGFSPLGSTPSASLDAGALTGGHASFTAEEGCTACHEAHGQPASLWLRAAFRPGDMTAKCTNCHSFGGPPSTAHNMTLAALGAAPVARNRLVGEIGCAACHTEHKGVAANLSTLSGAQCATCHEDQFATFDTAHPQFGSDYPHDRRSAIQFDHTSHLNKHFADARYSERAPAVCTDCHGISQSERRVAAAGFDETCAACHGDQMASRELVLLRFPELFDPVIDPGDIVQACGPTLDQFEALQERADALAAGDEPDDFEEDDYEAVSLEEFSLIGAYLLDVAVDDPDDFGEAVGELVLAMAEEGTAPLIELLAGKTSEDAALALLAGLSAEATKRIACAWGANLEYEPPADPDLGGWFGDFLELKYKPSGHADPVMRAWLDFAVLAVASAEDDDDALERAEAVQDLLMSPRNGAGGCIKCHAVTEVTRAADEEAVSTLRIEWLFSVDAANPFNYYDHEAHLRLVGPAGIAMDDPAQGCATCHKVNAEADYAGGFSDRDPHTFSSNFTPINRETCHQCHATGQVRQECTFCHRYHDAPAFKASVMRKGP
jgi:predicted CXXCH cytochrome family protein